MQKWEYYLLVAAGYYTNDIEEALRTLGEEGWELVSVSNDYHYFKRPKVQVRTCSLSKEKK